MSNWLLALLVFLVLMVWFTVLHLSIQGRARHEELEYDLHSLRRALARLRKLVQNIPGAIPKDEAVRMDVVFGEAEDQPEIPHIRWEKE